MIQFQHFGKVTFEFSIHYNIAFCLKFQDGYFLGELMSGQRGLVPSNFVEKVAGNVLTTPPPPPTITNVIIFQSLDNKYEKSP